MELSPGQEFGGKYKIVRLLGQGSMGAVYEGENVRIRRRVAIKTLHAGVAEKGDTLARFEREAQAAGRIGSKHIIEVLDMGDLPDGSRYMVMEYLDGMTLQQRIRQKGRLKPIEASPIVQELLEGLAAAHGAGIIHRDLKPANVYLVRSGQKQDFVKILDFGVSKFSVLSDEMSMTRTGAVLGTPYYMSPEQAKGSREIDARSDLYAVGVILYECITGQVPFSAETFNELLFRIVLEQPPPAESFVPDLPPSFAAIIRKSMAREPNERYQTADQFAQALAEWSAQNLDAGPHFDGMETLANATQIRAPSGPPALRPAPPSITASGTMLVEPAAKPAAAPIGVSGTVIIDPAAGGQPGVQGAGRAPAKTQPLSQWSSAQVVAAAQSAGPPPAPPAPPPPPGAPMQPAPQMPPGAPMSPNVAPGGWPMQGAPGAAAPGFPGSEAASAWAASPPEDRAALAARERRKRLRRTAAFLGLAAGLLLGVATWALVWRQGGDPPESPTLAASASDTPSPTGAPTAAASAGATATVASSTAPEVPSAAPSAESSAGPVGSPSATAERPTPVTTASPPSTGGTKPAATATGKATSAPGGKKPGGGRTISSDL